MENFESSYAISKHLQGVRFRFIFNLAEAELGSNSLFKGQRYSLGHIFNKNLMIINAHSLTTLFIYYNVVSFTETS